MDELQCVTFILQSRCKSISAVNNNNAAWKNDSLKGFKFQYLEKENAKMAGTYSPSYYSIEI